MKVSPLAGLALLLLGCSGTLPLAPAHAFVASTPHAPPIQLCWLEYATDHAPGSYGLAGGTDHATWEVTMSGLLVRHPSGDLLIDVGNSSHFDEEVETAHLLPEVMLKVIAGSAKIQRTVPQALQGVGEAPAQLRGIVASHIHADHAGGIVDLPGVPVMMSEEELQFGAKEMNEGTFHVVRAHVESLSGRSRAIRFLPVPYENFDRSLDYFGDGSVVFVPMPGHTPGSMGTFVNRSATERLMHVGDVVNVSEAVTRRRGKSVMLQITDHDGDAADAMVSKLSQLHGQDPALQILPAHDRTAWLAMFPGGPGTCIGAAR